MVHLRDAIVELYRKAATALPGDVVYALRDVLTGERNGSIADFALSVILKNIDSARKTARPICQDTGVPIFFVRVPNGLSHLDIRDTIVKATRIATREIPLRPNAVDILTEKNSGDNTGVGFPVIYTEETKGRRLIVDLMLKGSGSENIGQIYQLPNKALKAERDLKGVSKCVLDTILRAQGKGCPPYIVGVGIGATKDQVTRLAKEQLLRTVDDTNQHPFMARVEKEICDGINLLGIGTLGLGGRTTALGVKIGVHHRHPASYFVDVSVSCWADRRARMTWEVQSPKFKIQN